MRLGQPQAEIVLMPSTTGQRLKLKADKRNGSCGLVRILSPCIWSNGITACGACLPTSVQPVIRRVAWSPFFPAALGEDAAFLELVDVFLV